MKKRWIVLPLLLLAGAGTLAYMVEQSAVPPRRLAPYIERRAEGHKPEIVDAGKRIARRLIDADRGVAPAPSLPAWHIGAQASAILPAPAGNPVSVSGTADALRAITQARAGDVITFAPGRYRFERMSYLEASKAAGVSVRAARAGTVFLEFDMNEGFLVTAPNWHFENLDIRGVCKQHQGCEHAFHVTSGASGFVARNNTLTDFNAHFKINSSRGLFPDEGRIEQNTISNTSVRNTDEPVTPIDIVAANGWIVRGNLIADFVKGGGDGISYGAFAKGAGANTRFEGNAVLCERQLRGAPGTRVGLSLGGGGTGLPYCRDQRCDSEQEGGVIAANLIMSCSDEGIYLNRASHSKVLHNTLIDTAGIMARFKESSATVEGNIIDGRIATTQGAQLQVHDNLVSGTTRMYLGWHPQRDLFVAPEALDLHWRGTPARRTASDVPDLCGGTRPAQASYGAFEDFSACLTAKR